MTGQAPSLDALTTAARHLGVELAAIQAFADVERGPWSAFLPSGEPLALFERHLFHRYTDGRFDETAPDVSATTMGGYGPLARQHARIRRACALDREAALRATSWGLWQVLGNNWDVCGYSTLDAFVAEAYVDVNGHLRLFVAFVAASSALVRAIRARDWATAARLYNGSGYAEHAYDTRLAAAYARHAGTGAAPMGA